MFFHHRINRNILECKYFCRRRQTKFTSVLIETYWNVNVTLRFFLLLFLHINRNILECK